MSVDQRRPWLEQTKTWLLTHVLHGTVPVTIILACGIGLAAGYGAVLFNFLIDLVSGTTVLPVVRRAARNSSWLLVLWMVPAAGLLCVAWFTRHFAPEASGHGVPEVITAVARHDGIIRPRVSLVKIIASSVCIGTGGSVGREGPIVQIGSALGSISGQLFNLSARNIKVLVAAGAAAGISATFHAPLAGVMFASEIILGNFAVESLTPIVIASVLADVVHSQWFGGLAFVDLYHRFQGAWEQFPSYFLLGLICGVAAVAFTKLLYSVEDLVSKSRWWTRAIGCGALVGICGTLYPPQPPVVSQAAEWDVADQGGPLPALFGVGYPVVDHALHLEKPSTVTTTDIALSVENESLRRSDKNVHLDSAQVMLAELWWLLPLAILKPILTSVTLAGGGSGGVFAPSLFLGATLGACFGLVTNILIPSWSANPGVYAIVGMGAVVAGTTHGLLSAILIVYEMTGNYHIILPIMVAAGLSSIVSRLIDPESIYEKKLARRGESIARGLDMHHVEHVMVRDVMVRDFPVVRHIDNVTQIIRIARANSHIESLPVMNDEGQLVGIIRPEDLHRVLDSDISPRLVNAEDIALHTPLAISPAANLLEALREFGAHDVETLPVELTSDKSRRLVGLLLRADVMHRYRVEMLRQR